MSANQTSFFPSERKNTPQQILTNAIEQWKPRAIVSLFSGGYDSSVLAHLAHRLDTHGMPIHVWSADTKLAADGWKEYVCDVAASLCWDFDIHDNKKGFQQFVELVADEGCPKSRSMHTFVYQKLKERAFDAIHMLYKGRGTGTQGNKTLFLSGMRRAESVFRKDAAEVARVGHSNKIFCAPIVHWSQEDCDLYRVEHGLPDNPFYKTVKGSGDCQCNWGNFIDMDTLQKHSPNLAAGNVGLIDKLSKDLHGFGWHSEDTPQDGAVAELTSPFLCQGCSRAKVRAPSDAVEGIMLQRGLL